MDNSSLARRAASSHRASGGGRDGHAGLASLQFPFLAKLDIDAMNGARESEGTIAASQAGVAAACQTVCSPRSGQVLRMALDPTAMPSMKSAPRQRLSGASVNS